MLEVYAARLKSSHNSQKLLILSSFVCKILGVSTPNQTVSITALATAFLDMTEPTESAGECVFISTPDKLAPSSACNGACAHYVMVSKFQWKPFWLATQRDPQNDWTATQNGVNYDVFAQVPLQLQAGDDLEAIWLKVTAEDIPKPIIIASIYRTPNTALRWLGTVVTSHTASNRQAYTPVMSMLQKLYKVLTASLTASRTINQHTLMS